jgi:hypothetical protein
MLKSREYIYKVVRYFCFYFVVASIIYLFHFLFLYSHGIHVELIEIRIHILLLFIFALAFSLISLFLIGRILIEVRED